MPLEDRLRDIIGGGDDYGSARIIVGYEKAVNDKIEDIVPFDDLLNTAGATAKLRKEGFIENLELAQSYGQIENTLEDKKDMILRTVNEWCDKCVRSGNLGFFYKILDEFQRKIKEDAKVRGKAIKKEL